MASAPPSRRLSVVAHVAAPNRVDAREGAAHRRSEVPGGEGAPRVVLPPGESPVDPPGVDTADPRPLGARSPHRLRPRAPPAPLRASPQERDSTGGPAHASPRWLVPNP